MQQFTGRRLRDLREQAGLSKEQLAVLVRRSYPSINLYEAGRVIPPGPVLQGLAGVLGCRVGDFFEEADAEAVAS